MCIKSELLFEEENLKKQRCMQFTKHFNVEREVYEEASEEAAEREEERNELHVAVEVGPLPEILNVEVGEALDRRREHTGRVHGRLFDAHAQLEHDNHAQDVDDALHEQRKLERMAEPEQNAQYVGDEEREAHEGAEALGVLRPADHSVLRYVGKDAAEDHGAAGHEADDLDERYGGEKRVRKRLHHILVGYVQVVGHFIWCYILYNIRYWP